MLEVSGLRVGFGREGVVHGVSLTVAEGETLALVGESGCGKSMTAFAIVQLLPEGAAIQGGSVRLDGEELVGAAPRRLRAVRGARIGLVLQEPMTALNPVRSVGSQVAEAVARHERLGRAGLRRRVLELLELVGIPEPGRSAGRYPHSFSGGQRQRVMIAIAVACRPRLLIADEPTTALDVTIQAQILDLLAGLRRQLGMGMLLITHDLEVVRDWADRVAVMYAGRIVEQGVAGDVLGGPAHPYAAGLVGASVAHAGHYTGGRLVEIAGSVASAEGAPGCPYGPRCGRHVVACDAGVPGLRGVGAGHDAACIRA